MTKFSAAGNALVYSTLLGGTGTDTGTGLAVDGTGAAYVVGRTTSTNFPTQGPYQSGNGGGTDGFVTKFKPDGSGLLYSTYLGGSSDDFGNGIASTLPWGEWVFINPDLTLYIERPPVGEWICLEARTRIAHGGVGVAEGVLYDQTGRVGRATQALLVARR